jgi:hypothetical protein
LNQRLLKNERLALLSVGASVRVRYQQDYGVGNRYVWIFFPPKIWILANKVKHTGNKLKS